MADISATQTSNNQEWRTPKYFFDLLDQEFHFDIDAAATDANSLCTNWFTKESDGLKQEWWGNVFINCPYNQAKLWLKKAYEEACKGNCTVVLLVAARPDTRYWWNYARWGEVRFLKGRLKFEGAKNSAPFPSCCVVFYRGMKNPPKTVYWEIEKPKNLNK